MALWENIRIEGHMLAACCVAEFGENIIRRVAYGMGDGVSGLCNRMQVQCLSSDRWDYGSREELR